MTLSEQALMYNQRLRDVLQLIVNELNQGQQKKLVTGVNAAGEAYKASQGI